MQKGTPAKKRKTAVERDIEIIQQCFDDVRNDPKAMKQIREKLLKPIS